MYSVPKIPHPFCCSGEKAVSLPPEQAALPLAESEPLPTAAKNPSAALPPAALLFFSFLSQQKEG